MKQQEKKRFTKHLIWKGSKQVVQAKVVATMNYMIDHKGVLNRPIYLHMVESFINGAEWKTYDKIETEGELYQASQQLIEETVEEIKKLSEQEPIQTFDQKMETLFNKDEFERTISN